MISSIRLGLRAFIFGAITSLVALGSSTSALAADSCAPGEAAHAFAFTGGDQSVAVPAGATLAKIYINGAQGSAGKSGAGTVGGSPNSPGGTGGLGAHVTGSFAVSEGQTISVGVGGQGSLAFNAGGAGNGGFGNGGGFTDVRRGATTIAVAGGGGGGGNAGWSTTSVIAGGAGGNSSSGGAAGAAVPGGTGPFGGGGGAVGTGGAGGAGCGVYSATAGNATTGKGGDSFNFPGSFSGAGFGGGGGGGSTIGAGGGGAGVGTTGCQTNSNGGGGGGSGGASSLGSLTSAALTNGANSGNGSGLICFVVTPPTVASVSPNEGPVAGGTAITITGTNFSGVTSVTVGGAAATSVTVVNLTTITAITPAGTAGARDIVVTATGGPGTGVGLFTYVAPPTVTAVNPAAGPVAGGTAITITGTNLTGASAVTVGGAAATNVVVVNATTITATTPAGTAGARDIAVTTVGGIGTGIGLFTYAAAPSLSAITPNSGPLVGGTAVTITGADLNGATSVTIGGAAATSVVVVNATTITATTPAGTAGARDVVVTTPGGAGTGVGFFTYAAVPTVSSLSPASGPATGGTAVTVTGTDFTGATAVTFGGVSATGFTYNSPTSITATAPAGSGAVNVRVTTPGGTSPTGAGNQYTFVAAPTVAAVSPISGPLAGGTAITITGTNLTGASTVTVGGASATGVVVVNATTITATTPAGTAGARDIAVTTVGGIGTGVGLFTYDGTPPVLVGVPADIAVDTDAGLPTAAVTWTPPTATDAVPGTTVLQTTGPAPGAAFPIGVTTITYVATDAAGNTATASFTVTVHDAEAPVLVGVPTNITQATDAGLATAVVTWTPPTATDNAPGVTVLQTAGLAPGSAFPLGVTTVTYVATDVAGNTASASFTVTIGDTEAPSLAGVPSNIVVATDAGQPTAAVTWTPPTASDNAPGVTLTQTAGAAPGSAFPIGVTTITYVARDAASNTATASFTITVNDPEKPVLVGTPSNISKSTDPGLPTAVVTWTAPTATDNAPGVTVTRTAGLAPGSAFPLGVTTITYVAQDAAGNTATASFTVTVGDTEPPVLAGVPANIAKPTDPGLPTAVVTWTAPTATDNVPGVTISQTTGPVSGSAFPAGVTTITYVAQDAAGNTATASFTVTIGDTEAPVLVGMPANIAKPTDPGLPTAAVTWTPPTATDNVPGVTVARTAGPAPGSAIPIGVTTITYVATDAAGNRTSASFTITVNDAEAPVLAGVPADISRPTDPGLNTAVVTWTPPTATDNVPGVTVARTAGPAPGSAFPLGTTVVTYVATDAAGNTASASFKVTVGDGEAPKLATTPGNITRPTDNGLPTAVVTYATPTFTDNVGVTGVTQTAGLASGAAFPIGTTTNTFRARDAAGNTFDASFTVTVNDAQPPQIVNLPSNQSYQVDFPQTGRVVSWTAPTASDNAPGVTLAQVAGPASGSTFPIGVSTITYRATDASGNTTNASFTITINAPAPGSVSFIVQSPDDGVFGFSSSEPALNASVNASGGSGRSADLRVRPGTYPVAFTVPSGFGVTAASCSPAGSTLDPTTKTGQVVIVSGQALTCTVSVVPARNEAMSAIGGFMDTRADLIINSGPDIARRLDRLAGAGAGAGGTVDAFGMQLASSLPFSLQIGTNKVSFSYSLARSRAARHAADVGSVISPADRGVIGGGTGYALGLDDNGGVDTIQKPGGAGRFDFWIEGLLAGFDAGGGNGDFAIFHAGADYLVTPDLLVGVGVQWDWTDMDTAANGRVSGTGYLAGPYFTARLSANLYLDGRAAWGSSDNHVSPFGTYRDEFRTDRTLVTGALIGEFQAGELTIRPEARLTWFEETSDPYRDALGIDIPEIKVSTGQFQLGPELRWQTVYNSGATIMPRIKFDAIWTFERENTASAFIDNANQFDTGLRGRIEGGFDYANLAGINLSIGVFYDGIGDNQFQSWGSTAKVRLPF